jgi:integrase
MKKTLTDRFILGANSETQDRIFDSHTRGLVFRTGARGKVWYFHYRYDGRERALRLGDYPALSLAAARVEADDCRRLLNKGIDPIAERERLAAPAVVVPAPASPPVFTFAMFVPVYVGFQKGRVKEWADEASKIDRHLLPAWGALALREIKRPQVHELLDVVAGKGLTYGVNRIQALISRMFTVALDRGLVDAHPASRVIKRFTEQPRDRVLSDDEIRALVAGLDARPGAASDAVRLRLLLGQRGGETAGMLWRELNLEAGLWSMPAPRTKNGKPHVVPLPVTALELLKRRREAIADTEPRVFPGLTLTSLEHKALAAIHGGAYEWIDLRRTVGTRLAELGFDETTRGRVLNHARYSVTEKHYNLHAYDVEKRQALAAWDVELARILANKARKKTNVLPHRPRR